MTGLGERASFVLIAGLAGAAFLQPELGCVPPDGTDPPVVQELTDLLADVGPMVVVPTLEAFADDARALHAAADMWQLAALTGSAEVERDLAREAFLTAMDRWQQLEAMQIGPAGSSLTTAGGIDLRDEIYSWPTVNPCRIDQETVEGGWDAADFFSANLVNSYGLDAIEYLLYAPVDNACPGQVTINSEGDWDALGDDGVLRARSAFATTLAGHVVEVADQLLAAWDPALGDFAKGLAAPGEEPSPYASVTEAHNAVFDAMFYLETVTKDRKLAVPLGLADCTVDCELQVEGLPSGAGGAWIAANLEGVELLFVGGEGAGFDDLLESQGHGDLSDRILSNLAAAADLAAALDGPLDLMVLDDPEALVAVHDAIKVVTDDLKGDLVTVLALQVPTEAAGDND